MQIPEHHEALSGPGTEHRRPVSVHDPDDEQLETQHIENAHRIPEWQIHGMVYMPGDQPWARMLGLLTIGMVLGLIALTVILYFMY